MKKWSSFKEQQLITESWRKFLTEEEPPEAVPQQQYKTDDFCTEFPDACKGVLGTQRANMPQIPDVGNFKASLESPPPEGVETNEPEKIPDLGQATKAYLKSSDDAGEWPRGDQVKVVEIKNIDPMKLTPTQKDIYMANALKKVAGAEKTMASGGSGWTPWNGAVLVSKDNYLLDGHHRWAATIVYNQKHSDNKKMTVQKVMVPMEHLLKIANAYSDAAGGKRQAGGGTET
jgi:hypothetical protein